MTGAQSLSGVGDKSSFQVDMIGAQSQWGQEAMNKLSTWKTDYTATVNVKGTTANYSMSQTGPFDTKTAKARIHKLLDVMSANPPTEFYDQYRCVLILFRVTVGEYCGVTSCILQEPKCQLKNFRPILKKRQKVKV